MFSFCHCPKSELTPSFERFFTDNRSEHVCSVIQIKLSVGVTFLGSFWHNKDFYGKKCIKMLRSINFCRKVPRKYFFPDNFQKNVDHWSLLWNKKNLSRSVMPWSLLAEKYSAVLFFIIHHFYTYKFNIL